MIWIFDRDDLAFRFRVTFNANFPLFVLTNETLFLMIRDVAKYLLAMMPAVIISTRRMKGIV